MGYAIRHLNTTCDYYIRIASWSITPHQQCPGTTLSTTAADHKAEMLDRVVKAASDFAKENSDDEVKFLLAAGTAGIEAATNEMVRGGPC